ncbi:hypothetical protein ABT224_22010 [Streptomyces sp. NPDC001584]
MAADQRRSQLLRRVLDLVGDGSNWEYRGVGDAAMREMLDELSAHR